MWLAGIALLLLSIPLTASAELGGDATSVVADQARILPDLHQILGTSFQPFTQAVQAQKRERPGRGPLVIQQEELVVKSAGHARNFFGKAYLPKMLPEGVRGEEIR